MTIATADLHKAIATAWDAANLDNEFDSLWPAGVVAAQFPVLHDQKATPGQPFPYCVLDETPSEVVSRMVATSTTKWHIRDIGTTFNIYSQPVVGDSRDGKEIAVFLAEEIMKVFGGHPTVVPSGTITLDNGNHLITQYLRDFGVRTDDDTYQWVLSYNFRIDVPVAV